MTLASTSCTVYAGFATLVNITLHVGPPKLTAKSFLGTFFNKVPTESPIMAQVAPALVLGQPVGAGQGVLGLHEEPIREEKKTWSFLR